MSANATPKRELTLFRLLCFLAVFHPNCTRCCPDSSCRWAWEECPSCSSGLGGFDWERGPTGASGDRSPTYPPSVTLPVVISATDAGASSGASNNLAPQGGTLAFAPTSWGTFAVVAIADSNLVRVIRVDAAPLAEDPLTVRLVGDVVLALGDEPDRVVADEAGRVHVVLRGAGDVATIDPATLAVVDRRQVCPSPRALTFDRARNAIHVACASGEIVTLDAVSGQETRRVRVDGRLAEVAVLGDDVVASAETRLFVTRADGSGSSHDTHRLVGAMRTAGTVPTGVGVAMSNETSLTTLLSNGELGPEMKVGEAATVVSDMAIMDDGTVAIATGGDAFLLTSLAPQFVLASSALGRVEAVALADVTTQGASRRVLALRTSAPSMLTFVALGPTDPSSTAVFESLSK